LSVGFINLAACRWEFAKILRMQKMHIGGATTPRKRTVHRKKAAPGSSGLSPQETVAPLGVEAQELATAVERDGGAVIGFYSALIGSQ
jgi:hypothetical protein